MTETANELWQVPPGWTWACFADVAQIAQDLVAPSKVMDLPHIAPNHMESGTRRLLPYATVREDGVISAKQRFHPGQILYSKIRPNLRKAVAVDFVGVCSADVYPISPNEAVDRNYLLFWLTSEDFKLIALPHQGRTLLPKINQEGLNGTPLPVPPVAEQRRIVVKLDALTSRAAGARAELDRVPMLAARYREAVMRAGCLGQLTRAWRSAHPGVANASDLVARTAEPAQSRGGREATLETIPGQAGLSVNDRGVPLPNGWCWVPLLRVARQETGHTPSRGHSDYWDGGVPWIGIRDAGAHHGQVIQHTLQTISELGLENSSARLLPANTVCLSRTASVGYVTVMGRPMATSQDFATWTCTAALEPRYLMYALMAEGDDIRAFGKGSTHTTIYFPEIRALHIALPPIEEQRQIVGLLDAALAEIDRLATEADAARQLLERLDQAILAKAFRGELLPQDPNDEPASALLERIKIERASGAVNAKRGRPRALA